MTASWPERPNRLRDLLASGEPAKTIWVTVPWPGLVEMVAACGADAVLVDLEHVGHGIERCQELVVAADAGGITTVVRPAAIDPSAVTRILDIGAGGIVFPDVQDGADAERAARSLRYPPRGTRGWGGAHVRRVRWQGTSAVEALEGADGHRPPVFSPEYVAHAEDVLSIFLIESERGVANVEAILDAEPDAVMFGWSDYAVESGFDADRCREAALRVRAACRERGIGVSISTGQASAAEFYPGCFYVAGIDTLVMAKAFRELLGDGTTPPLIAHGSRT